MSIQLAIPNDEVDSLTRIRNLVVEALVDEFDEIDVEHVGRNFDVSGRDVCSLLGELPGGQPVCIRVFVGRDREADRSLARDLHWGVDPVGTLLF